MWDINRCMISLYVKTHNKTGLRYLGKTEQDPFKYRGSGVYWKSHIAKHGYDVSTEVVFQSDCIDEIKEVGINLSAEWNVVESREWANLMEENGIGGKTKTTWQKGRVPSNKGKKMPAVSEAKTEYWKQWRQNNPDYKSKWKKNERASEERLKEVSKIYSKKITKMNKELHTCNVCGKQSNIGNINRWHNENCKHG